MSTCAPDIVGMSDGPVSVDQHGVEYWWIRLDRPMTYLGDGEPSPWFIPVPDTIDEFYARAGIL